MRNELSKLNNKRMTFIAEFDRYGSKSNYHGFTEPTICFKNVLFEDGKKATDHIWFTLGSRLMAIGNLNGGDKVSFQARITMYEKGYYREYRESDYKLSNPTRLQKIMS